MKFSNISERQVTAAIAQGFHEEFMENIVTDVIIIGGGPSGLMCARDLAADGVKVQIVEANNYLGGGFWIGGYLMNKLTFRGPGEEILDELNIPYKKFEEGLFTADGPHACSKLIAAACEAGARILNMTKFDDVVYRNGKVEGAVINWTPVSALPRQITCVDPVAIEAKVVVDSTGHDAVVCRSLEKRNLLKIEGFGPMNVGGSEDQLVEKTGQIHPGLVVTGMAVSTVFGIPRMGPTFSGMLFSGRKAARLIKESLLEPLKV